MKQIIDAKRRDVSFGVRYLVVLKLQPYHQQSIFKRAYQKLSHRFYCPYKVLQKLRPVSYKLELPLAARVHPVFRIFLFKPYHGTTTSTITELPTVNDEGIPLLQPQSVIKQCWLNKGNALDHKSLIKWKHLLEEDVTWETIELVRNHFSDLKLENKLPFKVDGIDKIRRSTRTSRPIPRYMKIK